MQNINSERQHIQRYIEDKIGCASPQDLNLLKNKFKNFTVVGNNLSELQNCIDKDASSLFEKGLQCFYFGIIDIEKSRESWGLIKLYYSIYYFLRCRLAIEEIAIIRCAQIYYIKLKDGETPKQWRKSNGDHKATMGIYQKIVGSQDILNTQNINDQNPFEWFSDLRDWIQYRKRFFSEPYDSGYVFPTTQMTLKDQLSLFINDQIPVYCFDTTYATLALPLKVAQNTSKLFNDKNLNKSKKFQTYIENLKKSEVILHNFDGVITV
jgi:hypothetical protein